VAAATLANGPGAVADGQRRSTLGSALLGRGYCLSSQPQDGVEGQVMDLRDEACSMQGDLVELRRTLHREPEIGLDLPRTQERVLEALSSLRLEIDVGKSTTSVTAVLRGGRRRQSPPTTVLLRGDMDALPVDEEVDVDFPRSMAACTPAGTTYTRRRQLRPRGSSCGQARSRMGAK
jgi:hypothetical protein